MLTALKLGPPKVTIGDNLRSSIIQPVFDDATVEPVDDRMMAAMLTDLLTSQGDLSPHSKSLGA